MLPGAMPGRKARLAAALVLVAAPMAAGTGSASATTFCVPGFHSACPNSGGNVAEADLEKAMSLQSEDGKADQVVIAAGTFTEDNDFEPPSGDDRTFEPYGPDPLTIAGAGPGATILTSGGTGNIFLFNFSSSYSRPAAMRDLTLRIPSSFTDNGGGALQLYECVLENVDIVSLNPGSDGVGSAIGLGNVFRDGELRGEGGGSIDVGFRTSFNAELLVEDTTIRGASWALNANGEESELTARRVRTLDGGAYGVAATAGTANVENSTFTIDDGIGLYASANDDDATLNADHLTIVNSSGNSTAVEAKKFGGGVGDVTVVASNSIFRGFGSGFRAETTIGPGIGLVSLEVRYSNLPEGGSNTNGDVDVDVGNIAADPLLAADLSLPAGSPSVDAGDPAAGGLATDFLGKARPVDGNGDGAPRRDQGAFEYQVPRSPIAPGTDSTPPQTQIVKGPGKRLAKGIARFRFRSSEAGSSFRCSLDRRKPKRCRSPRTYKRLKPGRHVFRVWAIDASGNKDPTPAKRRFRVPR
jgi:hypothetical protein